MKKCSVIIMVVSLLVLALGLSPLLAQIENLEKQLKRDPDNPCILFELGRHFHNLGGESGSGGVVKKAEKYLSRVLELEPENALAMVYYGSALTMKARDAADPQEALEHLVRGFTLMDKAVIFAPNNPEIRLVRAANSLYIPDQFGRLSIALEDFEALDSMDQKELSDLGEKFSSKFYFFHGLALLRNGNRPEAALKFRKVLDTSPNSACAQMAREELGRLEKNR